MVDHYRNNRSLVKYYEPDWYCKEQEKVKALQKHELMSGRPVIEQNA